MKQKIAFIGYFKTFRYQDIGGSQSIVRRLSNSISGNREVFHLTYGSESEAHVDSINGIQQHHFESLRSMLSFAQTNEILDLIIIYLKPIDYLYLTLFRIFSNSIRLHFLVTSLSLNPVKRFIYRMQIKSVGNGRIFCVSKRLVSFFENCGERVIHLMPPVDDSFFINSDSRDEEKSKKTRIAFMGRLDIGKGTDLAIDYFEKSALPRDKYEFYVYGYPHESDTNSMGLHNKLLDEECQVKYVQSPIWDCYTTQVDEFLASLIDEVDLFYLPYRTISSTIDTPLVPLEILARGGLFLATDFPQIRDIIPDRRFVVSSNEISQVTTIDRKILRLTKHRSQDTKRQFSNDIDFRASSVASLLETSIQT